MSDWDSSAAAPSTPVMGPDPSGRRVGDAEREEVARLIGDATAGGLLEFEEMDERLSRAVAARTAELTAVTADLPAPWLERRRSSARSQATAVEARRRFRASLHRYAAVMTLLVSIWAIAGVTGGAWYP